MKKYRDEGVVKLEELYDEIVELFERANYIFLNSNYELFESNVSERTLCGALKESIDNEKNKTKFSSYHTDVEYNRNKNGILKTIINDDLEIVKINCDLILHSRGKCVELDNLIAIEMKKSNRPNKEKVKDRNRLIALTKDSYNDEVWSYDGKTLPEHVCRYVLGVYYEINLIEQIVYLEYYRRGKIVESKQIRI